ncbi:anti-phage dCTP deaminase [Paraburkholderia youngii]|uniref:anti-phage dCTP deaminase n=1 Tax=Paraburkholderia youngii TaxID=2782701 RepID=UPI003D20376E
MSAVARKIFNIAADAQKSSNLVIKDLVANELVFAVVGPAGSGTSWVAKALAERVKSDEVEITVIKASDVILDWARKNSFPVADSGRLARARSLQDAGDAIRERDSAGVAVQLISAIRDNRKLLNEKSDSVGEKFKIFILDSLKHPAEVALLRSVYQEAFCLIGVVCETEQREKRLKDEKCRDSSAFDIEAFIARDEDSGITNGQKVTETFHLADFFVNNTPERFLDDGNKGHKRENPLWDVNDQLGRLFDLLTHSQLVRPTPSETGMFHAHGAQMRSACLSRQVGAALLDQQGNLVSTGTNEVPRPGGGVYGGTFVNFGVEPEPDHRCAFSSRECSNNKVAEEIFSELVETLPELQAIDQNYLRKKLKKTALGRLIEFSRAVHAEMDALFSAARQGASPVGTRMFVTTFPCHYCARHIVSAGVDEVQYIEPYPKSRALSLHGDAIAQSPEGWLAPSLPATSGSNAKRAVLFRPFTGVAPRMYRRAFLKDRALKDGSGNMSFGEPEWSSGLLRQSYQDVENSLLENGSNG